MLLSEDETESLSWWDTLERLSRVCLRLWTVLLTMMLRWDATAKLCLKLKCSVVDSVRVVVLYFVLLCYRPYRHEDIRREDFSRWGGGGMRGIFIL